jgi:hypothetical protein
MSEQGVALCFCMRCAVCGVRCAVRCSACWLCGPGPAGLAAAAGCLAAVVRPSGAGERRAVRLIVRRA